MAFILKSILSDMSIATPDFFFDFFCDLLVIQQRVVQPQYVGIFNSFSPVIEI